MEREGRREIPINFGIFLVSKIFKYCKCSEEDVILYIKKEFIILWMVTLRRKQYHMMYCIHRMRSYW
jgi:hypothetical protein